MQICHCVSILKVSLFCTEKLWSMLGWKNILNIVIYLDLQMNSKGQIGTQS